MFFPYETLKISNLRKFLLPNFKVRGLSGYESFCYGINKFGKRNPRFTKSSRVCCSLDRPMNDQYFMLGIGEPLRV